MNVSRRGFVGSLLASPLLAKFEFAATPTTPAPVPAVAQGSPTLWTPPEATPFLTLLTNRERKIDTAKFVWTDKKVLTPERVVEWEYHNYAQIFRQPFGFAGRRPSRPRLSDENVEKQWQLIEHRKSIEYALFFGRRGTRQSLPAATYTTTGGVEFFCDHWPVHGNVLDYIANNADLMRWGAGGTHAGSATKYLFVSTARARTLGVNEAVSRNGRVHVVATPVLDREPEQAFLVDINHVQLAVLRPTKLFRRETEAGNGTDLEYLSDVGLEIKNPAAHSVFLLS